MNLSEICLNGSYLGIDAMHFLLCIVRQVSVFKDIAHNTYMLSVSNGIVDTYHISASMVELVYTADLKSAACKGLRVRSSPSACTNNLSNDNKTQTYRS